MTTEQAEALAGQILDRLISRRAARPRWMDDQDRGFLGRMLQQVSDGTIPDLSDPVQKAREEGRL